MFSAINDGCVDQVRGALESASPRVLNHLDEEGRCILCHAICACADPSKDTDSQVEVLKHLLHSKAVDLNFQCEGGYTPLIRAVDCFPRIDIVCQICDLPGVNVNAQTDIGMTALNIAIHTCNMDLVTLLLARPDINVDLCTERDARACHNAFKHGRVDVCRALLDHTPSVGPSLAQHLPIAVMCDQYAFVECFIGQDLDGVIHRHPMFSVAKVAPFLSLESAIKLVVKDLPIRVIGTGDVVGRPMHSFTWAKFLDFQTPLATESLRLATVKAILSAPELNTAHLMAARQLALSLDQRGQTVLHITDIATRDYLKSVLFFCGRYDISPAPPIYVSPSTVVVHAIDHGLFQQVFQCEAKANRLSKEAFGKCIECFSDDVECINEWYDIIKARSTDVEDDEPLDVEEAFPDETISEMEFTRFAHLHFGDVANVVLKFKRNQDDFERANDAIHKMGSQEAVFISHVWPSVSPSVVQEGTKALVLPSANGLSMAKFHHVLVMPVASQTLETIFSNEKPNDTAIQELLCPVVMALGNLNNAKLVHGDLTKRNILRVYGRIQLADFDAATPVGHDIGVKFTSGILPPEMFYKIEDEADEAVHELYWRVGDDIWRKMKPRGGGYVVRSFRHGVPTTGLPYRPLKASHAIDMWALGCMLFEMHAKAPLVPVDRDGDVVAEAIGQAATWTQEALEDHIRHHIVNELARDLILALLVVNPTSRIDISQVMTHRYFDPDGKTTGKLNKVTAMPLIQVSYTDAVTRDQVNYLAKTKEQILHGVFPATDVGVPTSFAILPFDLRDQNLKVENVLLQFKSFLDELHQIGDKFIDVIKTNEPIGSLFSFTTAPDMLYLYLVDELNGVLVLPDSKTSLYPLPIPAKSGDLRLLFTLAMPYVQAGFRLLKGANMIKGMYRAMGVPSNVAFVGRWGEYLGDTIKVLSVCTFDTIQAAVDKQEKHVPVERIRRVAQFHLVRLFERHDPDRQFAGMWRTFGANGQAIWTRRTFIEKFEANRPLPPAITDGDIQKLTVQQIYALAREEIKAATIAIYVEKQKPIVNATKQSPKLNCTLM
ncbi:Aste57867_24858 [Aphanomyces stellatus]|uniref:Cyclin-dependent kinase 2 homolog n=1 Tax=Aphanomyces stellatus TaxID=120398 RepID=A0A485LRK6_9STRA|nr:hypothetical protein As57867_024780 [Aphanomyces stellatus]VFU01492.1 Aste57867_24858 [Aphanomyces stellatus]